MTVKQLIEELQKVDQNKRVYLSDNELDEDTFFFQALDVVEINVEEDEIIAITFRK
jgi:hypothetical protein